MTRYYVDFNKDYQGNAGQDEKGRQQYESSTRKNVRVCDRREPGDQTILRMVRSQDIALADKICKFLNETVDK